MPKRGIPDQPVPRPAAHSRTSPPDGRPLPYLCPPTPVPADDSALSATAQALDDQGTPRLLAGKSSLDRHHRQRGEDAVFGIELHGYSSEHPRSSWGLSMRRSKKRLRHFHTASTVGSPLQFKWSFGSIFK